MDKRGWSNSELARRAGITPSNVSTVISSTRQPGWDFCAKIARPLGYTPDYVLRLAGLLPALPAPDGDPLLSEILTLAKSLDADERRRLARVAQLYLAEQRERYRSGGNG
jgi:transcriptional regulator with XRE-family HTH domain